MNESPTNRFRVSRCLPVLLVLAVGVALATLPHWRTGEAAWVADYDELAFYLPTGAAAYRENPIHLTDPATGGATYYQSLPAAPGVVLAKAFGAGVWHLGLCWRVLGGILVAVGWYALFRVRLRPWGAAAAACLVLADPGVLNGQLGYSLAKTAARSMLHPEELARSTGTPTGTSLPQWRIFNPLLSWPWWLLFFTLAARAVANPARGRVAAAGVACGLLFHVYFYLWTAAVAGLVLAAVIDRGRWKLYLVVLGIGLAIGSPAVIESIRFRAAHGDDWLLRTDKFLPVPRFSELLIPRVSLLLLAAVWVWVWRIGREWKWLACVATAAMLLLNQSVVTGLQIENFHWNFALGPALSFLLVVAVVDCFGRLPVRFARYGPVLGWVFACGCVGVGAWLYARSAATLPENRHLRESLAAFREQVPTLPAGGTVAGDVEFQYFAATGFPLRPLAGYSATLSPISDAELDARVALNAHLMGMTCEQFLAAEDAALRGVKWGREARSAEARDARLQARLAAFDAVARDVPDAVKRFDVRVIARRTPDTGTPLPAEWMLLQDGPRWKDAPRWKVWVRTQ